MKDELQIAIDKGFIPEDLKRIMLTRGHEGHIGFISSLNDKDPRIGVGYERLNDDGTKQRYIQWYEPKQIESMLRGYNEPTNQQATP